MAPLLSPAAIKTSLLKLHQDWTLNSHGDQIERTFTFADFYQCMAFANSVAWVAHQNELHPQLLIAYKTCRIRYSTHSVNGLTDLDFECACAIDDLLKKQHG